MDPLTAIGLASNILSFIDFSAKLIKGAYKIYSSQSGTTEENEDSSKLLDDLREATEALNSDFRGQTKHEKSLRKLSENCRQLSAELQTVLNKLRVTEKDSRLKSVVVSLMSMRKEKEIASIEKRLDSYRLEILLWLDMMNGEQQRSFGSQLDTIQKEGQRFFNESAHQLSDLREELHRDIQLVLEQLKQEEKSDSKTAQESAADPVVSLSQISCLLPKLHMMVESIPRENYVLRRLYFNDMYLREEDIKDAEVGTYTWMVIDESAENALDDLEKAMRERTRTSFLTWLRSGGSIYHISGKIGSGKSTLMKFLCNHSCVQKELEGWAEGKKLIFARFFFWNSGSRLQMSLEGLYRALLFETLKQCPELIQQIFPDPWDRFVQNGPGVDNTPFRLPALKAAFERLVDRHSFPNHRLCFFIDGLDEYEGETLEHWELARSLQKWAQSLDIKICVSSRPHTEFMVTFSDDPDHRVHLHELTKGDMHRFCYSMFEKDVMFDRISSIYVELVKDIVDRAEGVFLWVVLVVRSLLSGLRYCDPPSVLRERLDRIPKTLDKLFESLLAKIESHDRKRSDKLFLLATSFPVERHIALLYSWLDDAEDANFPFNTAIRRYSDGEITQRHNDLRRQLDFLTKGLLEMKPMASSRTFMDVHDDIYFHYEVGFLHRSVRDYLKSTSNLSDMKSRLLDINFTDLYCRLLLAQAKFARPHKSYLSSPMNPFYDIFNDPFRWFAVLQATGSEPSVKLVEEFREVVDSCTQLISDDSGETMPGPQNIKWGLKKPIAETTTMYGNQLSYLHYAAVFRQQQYVLQRVSANPDLLKNQDGLNLLVSAALTGNSVLVRLLLEKGASLNERVETEDMDLTPIACAERPTVWLTFLLNFGVHLIDGKRTWIWQPPQSELESPLREYSLILEHFLRFGANTDVCFILREIPTEEKVSAGNYELKPIFVSLRQFIDAMRPPNFESLSQFFRVTKRFHIFKKAARIVSKRVPPDESDIELIKKILCQKDKYEIFYVFSKDGRCAAVDFVRLY